MANIYHAGNQIGDAIPGHAIKNGSDVTMTQRNNLQFVGATVTDDNVNDKTVVTIDTSGDIGSKVTVTTSEAALDGATVTLTDGTTTLTGQIVSGEAVFANITFTGTYTITVTNGVDTLVKQLSAPYFGNYTIDFEIFNAYINITTTSANLYNQTITAYKDGVAVGTTAFNSVGSATYTASETGTYTFSVTISAGTFTSDPVAVTEETTYATTITSTFTVTVTIYSAAADTVSYTDANGAQTATVDSNGTLTNVSIEVSGNSPTITFTSSIAKDPEDLTASYSKAITITEETTEIYVMPDGYILYWWGYKNDIQYLGTTNGWSCADATGYSFAVPTFNANSIQTNASNPGFSGIGNASAIPSPYNAGTFYLIGISNGTAATDFGPRAIGATSKKVYATGTSAMATIRSRTELEIVSNAAGNYLSAYGQNTRNGAISALYILE